MVLLKEKPDWQKVGTKGSIGVDRDKQVIRGMIVAQEGPFKTPGRGEFNVTALTRIVTLTREAPGGLKSRFAHPGLSSDGIGKYLGRIRNPRLDKISHRQSEGTLRTNLITVVRADLHLDPTSRDTPNGDLGGYVMDLAESDPDALSSSLVLTVDQEFRVDKRGRPERDANGDELPPLWRPKRLHAADAIPAKVAALRAARLCLAILLGHERNYEGRGVRGNDRPPRI